MSVRINEEFQLTIEEHNCLFFLYEDSICSFHETEQCLDVTVRL